MIEKHSTQIEERRILQQSKNSVVCDNEQPGTGGKGVPRYNR